MNVILTRLYQYANEITHAALVGQWFGDTPAAEPVAVSYRQLAQQVEAAAAELVMAGRHCIALRADNCLNWAVADLAALQAGVTLVPVPTFFSEQQVSHLLAQAGVDALWGAWPQAHSPLATIAGLPLFSYQGAFVNLPDNTAKITFTSGSTGTPKGVCLSAQSLAATSVALVDRLEQGGIASHRHLVALPLSTLLENVTGLYVPLLLGATSYLFSGETVGLHGSSRFNAQRFVRLVQQYQIETLVVTPALLQALISYPPARNDEPWSLSLRYVAVGGAKVAEPLLRAAHQLGIPAYQGYGLSECGSVVSVNVPGMARSASCGLPLAHCQVRIDQYGAIYVKGSAMLGYINEPIDDEWLATGDLGYFDAMGALHITGRKSNVIITAYGRNISPEWVEAEAHSEPVLSQLMVVGEARNALAAIVIVPAITPTANAAIEAATLRLNQRLPDYARLERLLVISQTELLKNQWLTANGRWRRHAVQSTLAAALDELYHVPFTDDRRPIIFCWSVTSQHEYRATPMQECH